MVLPEPLWPTSTTLRSSSGRVATGTGTEDAALALMTTRWPAPARRHNPGSGGQYSGPTMLNRFARAFFTKLFTPVARLLLRLGISPDVVTIVGTLGVCFGALAFYPRHEFFWGTIVITALRLLRHRRRGHGADVGPLEQLGRLPRLHPRPGRRRGDLRRPGALLRRPRRPTVAWPALALACLILGSVVSYAKARAEGLGHDRQRRHRRARRPARRGARRHRPGRLGLPEVLLTVVLGLLAVASLVTVVQRMLVVRRQALGRGVSALAERRRARRLPRRLVRRAPGARRASPTAPST